MKTESFRIRLSTLALVVTLATLVSPGVFAADDVEAVRQQFIGDYELVSYMVYPAEGPGVDANFIARLSYDAFGNMAGQGMPKDVPDPNAKSSVQLPGSFAYWATVSFNLENNTVIHHFVGSPMNRDWVGYNAVRYFEFVDGFLKLSMKNPAGRVTATLTWRKLK